MRATTRLQRKTIDELQRDRETGLLLSLVVSLALLAMLAAAAWRTFGPDAPPRVQVEARDQFDAERWRTR